MKHYIGKFDEIKSLPDHEQMELLEKARYAVFREQGKSGRWVALFLTSLLTGFSLAVIILLVFGSSLIALGLGLMIGISLTLTILNIFYKRLLGQGLRSVLTAANA